ncbi:hypothetical protein [Gordonia polyisoprenivorans]|uniref:hypothetical protein n=1 Tax=Gordonia polyisoprenivorans TaxID=84595 RepID=UPI000B99F16A|nr:hypothetical protein [Gordonia polyisoprenivorans]OZC29413.1 hypothetical protein CJJ17_26975 [Gordonia polyisoprenivorans]
MFGQRSERGRAGISWPVVLMSGGIAAIISAVVVSVGVVGLMVASTDSGAASNVAQPTVVNLGAATSSGLGSAGSIAPAEAPAAAPTAEVPAAELPVAEAPPVAGAPNAPAIAVPSAVPSAPATATAAARTVPTAAQLQNDLAHLASGASTASKAQRLEGGARAVAQAQPLLSLLARFAPLGLTYGVVDPVTVNGDTLTAPIEFRSPGYQPARITGRWLWLDGRWKLSNKTVCDIGSYSQLPCTL